MGTAYLYGNGGGGSGGGLNFKVVGGVMPFGYINCKNFTASIGKVSVSNVEEKRITVTADGAEYRCASYDFDVLPGQDLTFSAEVESGYTGYPCLGLRKYEGGSLVANLVNFDSSITDGKLTFTQTVPAGVTKMRLELFCSWSTAGSGSVTYKNVMIGSSTVNAKENMVWANTDTGIHRWDFSASEPQLVSKSKNLLPKMKHCVEKNGVTYTFNADGSITLNGTSPEVHNCARVVFTLPAGSYIVSGSPSGSALTVNDMFVYADDMAVARSFDGTKENAFTLTETKEVDVYCRAARGSLSNVTFHPMIRKASATAGYEPFDATGHVWIVTDNANSLEFNALKKNGIQVNPTAVRQYAGGKWSNVYASIYKDNQWVQFSSVFSSTISITYPAGSTCTCSDGKTTLRAPNTSGTWKCVVPNTGSWTVSCTNGTESTEEIVAITTDGQSVSVELAFWHGELYESGNEYTDITGGFVAVAMAYNATYATIGNLVIERNSGNLKATQNVNYGGNALVTANKIDLSGFKKLCYIGEFKGIGTAGSSALCVWSELGTYQTDNLVEKLPSTVATVVVDGSLDISGLPSGKYYIGFHLYHNTSYVKITKMWLE